ncbi:hypothetical protein [Pseudomonas putida]|uniref:hypothetical protein n=1 Tax=Pseudomonas putida TaxID=303 RepID=UPI0039068B6A
MTNVDPSKKDKSVRASKNTFTLMELKAIHRSAINSRNSRNIHTLELLYSGVRAHEIVNSTTKELSLIFTEWLAAAGVNPKGRTLHNLRVSLAHQFAKLQTNIPPAAIIALTKHH